MIFGPICGCLGIFHFMKRIVDTLRPNHSKYWDAMIALKDAIYRYETGDYQKLYQALTNGTMAKDKKCYSALEINNLRHSKKFKQRYAKYLRKVLHRGHEIKQKLLDWKKTFKEQVDPTSGKKLFTPDTKAAVENQLEHVEDIQFPPKMEMYRTILPGPRSTHHLSSYRSINPEPMLESWHGRFAHMGNTGMRPGLADCLHLRGACEGNVVVRHKLSMMNEDSVATLADPLEPPGHLRDRPVLKDHCLGKHLNESAAKAGCKLPYRNIRPVYEDNGEVFLYEYYQAQRKRYDDPRDRPDTKTKRCCCKSCGRNPIMLINEVLERELEEDIDDEVVTEEREVNVTTGACRTLTLAVTKATCVLQEGLNVTSPIAPNPIAPNPIAPTVAIAPTALTRMQVFHFADNQICCFPFFHYMAHARTTGRCRPGPRPHQNNCRNYRARKAPTTSK
jgi:hypothetical protein